MSTIVLYFLLAILSVLPKPILASDTTLLKETDGRLKALKQHVLEDILSDAIKEADVLLVADKIKADGSWADIDYTDKTRGGWPVADHLARINHLAIVYRRSGSKWKGDEKLEKKIITGLEFWIKNDFICPNWWYPEIGVPKVLGPAMLLMEEKLTPALIEGGIKILNRAKIGMTGQNKVWLSGNVIYRSLLTNDVELIRNAVKTIQDEVIVSEGEGIQPDYSFHQHGPQQQFGNYGSAYASDMLKWAAIFQNTPFQFSPDKVAILRNYLLQGMKWVVWKNKMDISACGRQLFPGAQTGKVKSIERIFNKMPIVDQAARDQYLTALNDFNGNKHFWRSDMTVHRRAGFYTSLKMASTRVAGAESCNEENVQGYHLGDGSTYFYQSNNEYMDIFPFWDWKMIPGTTTFHDSAQLPVLPCNGYRINSDFVGGVSDGLNGVATLAYNRDQLQAQKSWFYFNDVVICLGAGIQSTENKEVRTTINQSLLKGDLIVKQRPRPTKLDTGQHQLAKVSWLLQDNWGYYFPEKSDVEVQTVQQTGDWHRVLTRMPSVETKANIFSLYYNHGPAPKNAGYAYFVFPAANASNIEGRAAGIELIENSDIVQVVEHRQLQILGAVFVQAGKTKAGSYHTISTDKPCVVMISKKDAGSEVSISDPTHLQKRILLGLKGKKKSTVISSKYDASSDLTVFSVDLPAGPEAGKTVRFIIF